MRETRYDNHWMHFSGSGLHILCAYACRHGACSVTPQQENALRSIARQANSEIKKARQQFPDKNVDDICRSVLKKHRETVTLMGFTPTHLSLAIGMLNGVFKERWTWKAKSSGSYRLLFYYSHSPSSVLTNNSGINERWRTSLIQHQKLKNYSAIQQ